MVLDLPGGLFEQRDVRETPAGTSSSTSSTSILAPVGSIMAWLKSFTNTPPSLPDGWMEADGSAISDVDSVYNGQNAPDLNGNEFVRGAATSGGTGGGTTGNESSHTHYLLTDTINNTSVGVGDGMPTGSLATGDNPVTESLAAGGSQTRFRIRTGTSGGTSHNHSSEPKFYDVVWIFRFK